MNETTNTGSHESAGDAPRVTAHERTAARTGTRTPPIASRSHARRVVVAGSLVVAAAVAAFVVWRAGRPSTTASVPGNTGRAGTAMAGGDMRGMRAMNMSSDGTVQLTANQLHEFGVTFGSVEERTLDNTVRTTGTVAVDETTLADVTPRFAGYVERLYVDETGQPVRKGEPLMDIYSPELVAAEQELLIASKLQRSIGESSVPGVPAASTDLVAAAKRRFALWDIADAQVEQILRSGQVQRTLTLYAPASGVVLEKHVVRGQAIQPGATLYRIANLSEVWIDAALREQDASAVRTGSRASVELASYPGRPIDGRVAYVYPTLDQSAHTVRARIEVPNPSGRLKPGMYATVTLITPTRRALTVPTSAVLNTGDRTLVFMDMGGGRLMPMEVVTGRTAGQYTEILSGLEPGQRVVTSAQYLLDSESNLAEVMKSMIGQMNMSGGPRSGQMKHLPGMDMSGQQSGTSMPMNGDSAGMTDTSADMKGMSMPATHADSTATSVRGKDTTRGMPLPPERR